MSDHTTISNINNRTGAGTHSTNTVQSWKKTKNFRDVQTSRTAAHPISMTKESFFETTAKKSVPGNKPTSFETALIAADKNSEIVDSPSTPFGFEDILDVINPLQHLPVINIVYRSLTGDTIKPMAQIIGGGLYGGPIGAISGTVNAVIEHETGHDIAGNVLALVQGENKTKKQESMPAQGKDNPEKQLEIAAQSFEDKAQEIAKQKLPGTTMAFVNLKETEISYDKRAAAEGRTAGYINVRRQTVPPLPTSYPSQPITQETLPRHEAITSIEFAPLPPKNNFYN